MANKYLSITAEQLDALVTRLGYDEPEDRIVATASISTLLNSFYIGGQHRLSSGGDMIYTTNITKDINHYHLDGGFKNQFILANQDESGIIKVQELVHSKTLTTDIRNAEKTPITYVPFNVSNFTVLADRTSFGFKLRMGVALSVGDKVKFSIIRGGVEIYRHLEKVTTATALGDFVTFRYLQPVTFTEGDVLDIEMAHSTDNGSTWTATTVSESVASGVAYDEVYRRTYTRAEVLNAGRVIDSTTTGDDLIIKPFDNILVGTLTGNVTLTLRDETTCFTIRDLNENLGNNEINVTLDPSNSLAVDSKNDYVIVNKVNNTWYYFNYRNGKGEVI